MGVLVVLSMCAGRVWEVQPERAVCVCWWQSQQPGYQGRLKSRLLFDAANALCWHVTIPVGVAMFVDGHVRGNKWQWKVAVYKNQEKLD